MNPQVEERGGIPTRDDEMFPPYVEGQPYRTSHYCTDYEHIELWRIWRLRAAESGGDPAVAAEAALAKVRSMIGAKPPKSAPPNAPGKMGIVGFPVWVWTDQPATLPDVTGTDQDVTVVASTRLERLSWDFGDGTQKTCTPAQGTPFQEKWAGQDSPSGCSHVYLRSSARQPGKTWAIRSTSEWVVTWRVQGAGGAGTQVRISQPSPATNLTVGEVQVVYSGPKRP